LTKKAFSKPGIDRLTELIDIAQRNTINVHIATAISRIV